MNQQSIKIVEAAQELLRAHGYFVENMWHVEDVHFICEQINIPLLADEEAMQVFAIAGEEFDGETGISWPQLEKALYTFIHRKTVLKELCEKDPA
jgi:hypothetical protein